MAIEALDEVPVPHFEDQLWSELAALHELHQRTHSPARSGLDPVRAPGPIDAGDAGRGRGPSGRLRRRGPGWRTAGIGIVSLAAAAVAVAALVVAHPGPDRSDNVTLEPLAPGTDTTTTTAPSSGGDDDQPVTLQAHIIAATDDAVASSIVHVFQDSTHITDAESWSDEQSGVRRDLILDADGQPSFDSGRSTAPTVDEQAPPFPDDTNLQPTDPRVPHMIQRQVDYCFHEYADTDTWALPGYSEAGQIRDGLESGDYVIDGTETVDGREMIRVVQAHDLGEGYTYLVDPDTYRPIQLTGYAGTEAEYVMHFDYLPRTPENLALLTPPVPDGFVPVDQLRGDGERLDAGCT